MAAGIEEAVDGSVLATDHEYFLAANCEGAEFACRRQAIGPAEIDPVPVPDFAHLAFEMRRVEIPRGRQGGLRRGEPVEPFFEYSVVSHRPPDRVQI